MEAFYCRILAKCFYTLLLLLIIPSTFSFAQEQRYSRELKEDDECDCTTETPTNIPLDFYQLDVDIDNEICSYQDGYIHFNYPDMYLDIDSFQGCAQGDTFFRHKLFIEYAQVAFEVYSSNSPPPDSLNYTSLLLDYDSTFNTYFCSSGTSKDSFIVTYSFIDYSDQYDSCSVSEYVIVNCSEEYQFNANIFASPGAISCSPITVISNYSSVPTVQIDWYENNLQSSSYLITDDRWIIDYLFDGTIYGVILDTNYSTCRYGSDTVGINVNYQGFEVQITNNGSLTLDCSDPTNTLSFSDLYLIDSSTYTSHTFQWLERINGVSFDITGETHAKLSDIDRDGDFAIEVIDTSTGCSDVSNFMTISGINPSLYTLGVDGGTTLCLGGDSPILDFLPVLPYPFPSSATMTVLDDGVSQGSDITINSEGYYYVELTFAGGCGPHSDSLLVDIDTVICDSGFVVSPNNFICTSDPVAMINRGTKNDLITYTWNFTGGTPSSYIGYYPPLVNYSSSGNYTITMIMSSSVSVDTFNLDIDVLDDCCEHSYSADSSVTFKNAALGSKDNITTYSDGGTFNGTYNVLGTIVLSDGIYTIEDGSTFYVDSECENCDEISQISEGCNIYGYTDITQIILQNATLNIGDAEFRATCDKMWYGIAGLEGSIVNSLNDTSGQNALVMDALVGISICDPEYEYNDYYQLDEISFLNNVFGFAELDKSSGVFNYLRNAHIDVDSSLMKAPYQSKLGLIGVQLEAKYHYEYFDNNYISNQLYGYYSDWIGDPDNSYRIKNNTIRDFQIAGIALGGSLIQSEVVNNVFYFPNAHLGSVSSPITLYSGIESSFLSGGFPYLSPSGPFEGFTMDEDEIIGALLFGKQHFYNNKFFGLDSSSSTLNQSGAYLGVLFGSSPANISLTNNYFHNLSYGIQDVFAHSLLSNNEFIKNEIGLRLPSSSSADDYLVQENIFQENKAAIQIVNFERELSLQENLFLDNDTAISVLHDDNSDPLDMVMNCNKFQLDNTETYTRYGLFVHSNADMGDIGGDDPGTGNPPAGNGWPVDPSSTGYSNCTTPGASIDVNQWSAPSNWVSIEDNSSSTWEYFAYHNEFTGTFNPSGVLDRQDPGVNAPTCAVQDICFPLARILSELDFEKEAVELSVYPNPANNLVFIKSSENETIELIRIYDAALSKSPIEISKSGKQVELNINDLPKGLYFIEIWNQSGTRDFARLVKQ